MLSYGLMVLFAGGGALRDASGNITDLLMFNGTVADYSGLGSCVPNCTYGLHNSYSVCYEITAVSALSANIYTWISFVRRCN